MTLLRVPLIRKLATRLLGPHGVVRRTGTFREKELHGLIERPNYAYGMLRAADVALYFGKREVTVCEFGVATGNGLMNMAHLARLIQAETGVRFHVYGFDTGKGLPDPKGHVDHPELWNPGDFSMGDNDALRKRLGDGAKLVIGDIADTISSFRRDLSASAPLGFVSIDVDIYTGTVSALKALHGHPEQYLPAISFYFDDVGSFFNNMRAGELLAIDEHNQQMPNRVIDCDHSLPGRRADTAQSWYKHMYVAHILDHPARMAPRARETMSLEKHLKLMEALN
jgi:hypothetical protein